MNKELDETALRLANSTLKRGFDAEAYICKYIAEKSLNELASDSVDRVPESSIDEQIDDINGYFITYMRTRTDSSLEVMLVHIRQMLSELYHTCSNSNQRKLFESELSMFTNIIV